MQLAERLGKVKPSATLAVTAATAVLRQQGKDVVDFGTGEPDFDTPEHIKTAAVAAMAAGQTKYTPSAARRRSSRRSSPSSHATTGSPTRPTRLIASCGGKHSLATAFLALFQEGDEVIVAAPFWVSYADMLVLAGATPVIVPTDERAGFVLTPAALEAAITRARAA